MRQTAQSGMANRVDTVCSDLAVAACLSVELMTSSPISVQNPTWNRKSRQLPAFRFNE